jgi:hypothetical protein
MREIILQRIEEMKEHERDFAPSSMRWQMTLINGVHISVCDFSKLTDVELVTAFERICQRYYRQY